jgi:hypothetical protein
MRACCAVTMLTSNNHYAPPEDASDDWIPLRDETRPWPCGTADVYVTFEFRRQQPSSGSGQWTADETDTLKAIHILKTYDCL